jgi:predicted lipid-binding transport protein (Tim44 family)
MSLELIILAIIAAVVLYQLYNVLGKNVGLKAEDKLNNPKSDDHPIAPVIRDKPVEPAKVPNAETLKGRDPNFNEATFIEKAKEAYEQIVLAFNRGEIEGLKERLSDSVYSVFSTAISSRGDAKSIEAAFVDSPKADIDVINLKDDLADIRVRFLSELVYETKTLKASEGSADEIKKTHRRTAEYWTFQKNLKSANNPWILNRVEAAKA